MSFFHHTKIQVNKPSGHCSHLDRWHVLCLLLLVIIDMIDKKIIKKNIQGFDIDGQTADYSILLNRYQFVGRSHLIKWQDGNVVWSDEWTLDFLCCIQAGPNTKDQFENEIWQDCSKIQISNVPRDLLFCHILIWWEYL